MSPSKNTNPPRKRRRYDETFRAEALRLASKSRSTQAAARQLGISAKRQRLSAPAHGPAPSA